MIVPDDSTCLDSITECLDSRFQKIRKCVRRPDERSFYDARALDFRLPRGSEDNKLKHRRPPSGAITRSITTFTAISNNNNIAAATATTTQYGQEKVAAN